MPYTELTALWSGFSGAPGYTRIKFVGTLDAAAATAAVGRLKAFFDSVASLLPPVVAISYSSVAQQFNDQHELIGEVGVTPPAATAGTGGTAFAAPVGLVVNWLTSAFSGGRRIRGRTFIVPMSSTVFFTDGTPTTTALTNVTAAAQTLLGGTPGIVVAYGPDGVGGGIAQVTSSNVPDRAAVLRSRRD